MAPKDVPSLMQQWFTLYHELMAVAAPGNYVALHVSFVPIHPLRNHSNI
nr:hypothetical protein [uncultured Desulfobacter sp.]